MSKVLADCIDENKESLLRIKMIQCNRLKIECKISICGTFNVTFLGHTSSTALHDPSPCQYAIIQDTADSLRGLLHLSIDSKDNPSSPGVELKLDDIFSPFNTTTNTKYSLLHLAVMLGRYECLEVLVLFLEQKGELEKWINAVDLKSQKSLLTQAIESVAEYEKSRQARKENGDDQNEIAFHQKVEKIIPFLIKKGADIMLKPQPTREANFPESFYVSPFVTCATKYPDYCIKLIEIFKENKSNEEMEKLSQYVSSLELADNNSIMVVLQNNGSRQLVDYLLNNNIYVVSTPTNSISAANITQNTELQPNQEEQTTGNSHKCEYCDSRETKIYNEKYYCEYHLE
ncbi:hypothetical protein TRFO_28415 [Tritrichomonas foetus]|uniref:Uncharacterized protein n=1 Tax=Tritrichomonas foetus TaxID=1144522 RepID=A0A1J4K0C6_9EUKA|nr:hypothetical protein TRFO_28415 [Tritrichomonas foetus]|eukprot:OHT04184.1 hypothetical protein TRFO_28415 [Tritrichomonas foetus]